MNSMEDNVLRLTGLAYDAALDESKWPSFLEAFASAVTGSSAFLRSHDTLNQSASFNASVGYDPAWQAAYCDHFVKRDYYNYMMAQYAPGQVVSSARHIDQHELRKTEYFNDYLLPQDKMHAIGTFLLKDANHSLLLGIQRGKLAGAFGDEEMQLMSLLAPHIKRAVHVHQLTRKVSAEKEWAHGALDQLRIGVMLVDRTGAPLFANRAAELILASGQGVNIHRGKLVLSSVAETLRLHKLINAAAQAESVISVGGDMNITLSGGEFLHCTAMPITRELSARWDISVASGCVALFLAKPSGLQLPPKRLAELYGLTPAEARLAAKLASLKNMEQAADDLCISVHTARTQLKSIFAKTGAQSQPELLMLLSTGTLAVCRDET